MVVKVSDDEVIHWVALLGSCKVTKEQAIIDLLNNSKDDGMTEEDRIICKRALQLAKTRPSWRSLHMGAVEAGG